jgi:hypothetical protein
VKPIVGSSKQHSVRTPTVAERVRAINPDRLAALEEERSFLLRSLADLEREHDAGDVDDDDYHTLKDDYTVRAAAAMRAVEQGKANLPARRSMTWQRFVAGAALCLAASVIIGWVLTRATTDRREGDVITGGGPRVDDVNSLLVEARSLQTSDPRASIETYERILKLEPDNVEALTYRGWTVAFVALQMSEGDEGRDVLVASAAEYLDRARAADPTYPDAQCFTAIVRFRFQNDAAGAKDPLDQCRSGNLPVEVAGLVDALGTQIDDALAAGDTAATTP